MKNSKSRNINLNVMSGSKSRGIGAMEEEELTVNKSKSQKNSGKRKHFDRESNHDSSVDAETMELFTQELIEFTKMKSK